jgi:hypothetical protein
VADLYLARWEVFLNTTTDATVTGQPPDWDAYAASIFQLTMVGKVTYLCVQHLLTMSVLQHWNLEQNNYPTQPSGENPLNLAGVVLSSYATGARSTYVEHLDCNVAGAVFNQVGEINEAAIGSDCWLRGQGPPDSLAVCLNACAQDQSCNTG